MGNGEGEEMSHETHSQKRWSHLTILKGFVLSHHLVDINSYKLEIQESIMFLISTKFTHPE